MKLKQKIILVLVMMFGLFGVDSLVAAPSALAAATCAGVEVSIIKCDTQYDNKGGVETNGVWALLLLVINILTAGVGIVAVGGIVYGSILYASAGDSAEQVKKAITVITNVVIGIVAYVAMFSLLNFIIPGGIFAKSSSSSTSKNSSQSNSGTTNGSSQSNSGTTGGSGDTATDGGPLGEDSIASLGKCGQKTSQSVMAHFSPYPLNNSTQGELRACKEGYPRIDHDFQVSKDGVVINTHWPKPSTDGFVPSNNKISFSQMTWSQISELESPDGYTIRSAYQTFKQACSLGINVFFEAKGDSRFEDKATWEPLAEYGRMFCGANWTDKIKVNTQCSLSGAKERLAAARAAGFTAASQCF